MLEVRAIMVLPTLAVLAAVAGQVGDTRAAESAPLLLGKMAVVGVGYCEDGRIGQVARVIRSELRLQQGAAMLSEDDTAGPAGGLQAMSLEEIRKTINEGRTLFFRLDYGTAETTLRSVLPDIDRLPPGPGRWSAASLTRIEVAHVSMFNQKRALADEMLFDVVRLQEDLELDRHLYPPLLRDELEKVRRSVKKARRFRLRISSAEREQLVFVNGREMGKTPFERALVEGSYEVIVGDPPAHSFVRRVELHADTELPMAEVARESRFKAQAGPCYEAEVAPEERVPAAALLATALGVDQVAVVRLEKAAGDEYVGATLYDAALGREVRDGRQRFDPGETPRLKKLGRYLLTGDRSLLAEPGEEAPILKLPTSVAPGVTDSRAQRASFPWLRAGGIALGVVAVGLSIAAIVENGLAASAKADLTTLSSGHSGPVSRSDAERASAAWQRFDSAKQLRNGFALGAAVAALGSGTLFIASLAPAKAGGEGRVTVAVMGHFP